MMSEIITRRGRRVTRSQLESLWVFLSCHKNIAVGINKTLEDREKFRRLWMRVATNINGLDGGGVRDWKGWAKYWVDYKAKLKRRALETKKIRLTEIEKKFMALINCKTDQLAVDSIVPNGDMPSSLECHNELQESSMSLDGFTEMKHSFSSNVMEKLVDVLKDIHKTLVRIEEKLPTFETDIKHGNGNDNSTLLNESTYTL